jgi:hypothetical protein
MEVPVIAEDHEAQMIHDGYVSADSHVVEPGELWVTRMDKRFRDNAPRVEPRPDGNYYIIKGIDDFPVALEGPRWRTKSRARSTGGIFQTTRAISVIGLVHRRIFRAGGQGQHPVWR